MLSIYIHWPFCLSKCHYCDFNSYANTGSIDDQKWLNAYKTEIQNFLEKISGKCIKSIYFGGGTPSLMNPSIVEGIIDQISRYSSISTSTEITLESNPTSFEIEKFKTFKTAGINRVSIGVQSLRDKDLKHLGRKHNASIALQALKAAASLFQNYSFDLIYARSGQSLEEWKDELAEAINIGSPHVSLYQLTIEKGTLFHKLFNTNKLVLPEEDTIADMYEWTNYFMSLKGYNRYEISNYAIDLNESQHNLTYWNYNTYIGIGPGAHSRIIDYSNNIETRVNSIKMYDNPNKWLAQVYNLNSGIQSSSFLSTKHIAQEFIMMGLRLKKGISLKNFTSLVSLPITDLLNTENLSKYEALGLLSHSNDTIYLTDKGLMLHNYLVPRLISESVTK